MAIASRFLYCDRSLTEIGRKSAIQVLWCFKSRRPLGLAGLHAHGSAGPHSTCTAGACGDASASTEHGSLSKERGGHRCSSQVHVGALRRDVGTTTVACVGRVSDIHGPRHETNRLTTFTAEGYMESTLPSTGDGSRRRYGGGPRTDETAGEEDERSEP